MQLTSINYDSVSVTTNVNDISGEIKSDLRLTFKDTDNNTLFNRLIETGRNSYKIDGLESETFYDCFLKCETHNYGDKRILDNKNFTTKKEVEEPEEPDIPDIEEAYADIIINSVTESSCNSSIIVYDNDNDITGYVKAYLYKYGNSTLIKNIDLSKEGINNITFDNLEENTEYEIKVKCTTISNGWCDIGYSTFKTNDVIITDPPSGYAYDFKLTTESCRMTFNLQDTCNEIIGNAKCSIYKGDELIKTATVYGNLNSHLFSELEQDTIYNYKYYCNTQTHGSEYILDSGYFETEKEEEEEVNRQPIANINSINVNSTSLVFNIVLLDYDNDIVDKAKLRLYHNDIEIKTLDINSGTTSSYMFTELTPLQTYKYKFDCETKTNGYILFMEGTRTLPSNFELLPEENKD